MNSAPVEHSRHCYCLLPLHLPIIPGYPGVLWAKVLFSPQHCQARWGDPGAMYFLLGDWQVEGHTFWVSHTVELDIIIMPIHRGDKRVNFLPPLWEPVIPLQISLDPLTGVIGIIISSFPWLLSLQGRATVGCSGGNRNSSLLGRFYKPGDFCMSGGRAWHSWWPISFT